MEVSGQHHAPTALPSGKCVPLCIYYCAVWTPDPVWKVRRKEKSKLVPGIGGKKLLDCTANRAVLLTGLFRLLP